MKDLISKSKKVLVTPKDFFNSIKKEKGLWKPLKYLILFLLLTQLFLVFHYFENVLGMFEINIDLSLTNYIIMYLVTTIMVFVISFIRPAITNVFIRMFSDENKLEDTYKAMIYGLTPDYLATPFFVITMIFISATVWLENPFWMVLFIISSLITLVAAGYTLYLRVYGVANLHKISWIVAFLCIYVFPVILIIILEVAVLGALYSYLILL